MVELTGNGDVPVEPVHAGRRIKFASILVPRPYGLRDNAPSERENPFAVLKEFKPVNEEAGDA